MVNSREKMVNLFLKYNWHEVNPYPANVENRVSS